MSGRTRGDSARHHREWSREERGGGIVGGAGTRRVHPAQGGPSRAISRKRPMRLKTRANGDNPSSSNLSANAIATSLVMKGSPVRVRASALSIDAGSSPFASFSVPGSAYVPCTSNSARAVRIASTAATRAAADRKRGKQARGAAGRRGAPAGRVPDDLRPPGRSLDGSRPLDPQTAWSASTRRADRVQDPLDLRRPKAGVQPHARRRVVHEERSIAHARDALEMLSERVPASVTAILRRCLKDSDP